MKRNVKTAPYRPTDAELDARFPGFIPLSDVAACRVVLNIRALVRAYLDADQLAAESKQQGSLGLAASGSTAGESIGNTERTVNLETSVSSSWSAKS